MKPHTLHSTIVLALGLALFSSQAQEQPAQQSSDTVVALVADAMSLPFVPADERPIFGTYWEVLGWARCEAVPVPCPPMDTSVPVYWIGGHHFLVDKTAGQTAALQAQRSRGFLSAADAASTIEAQVVKLETFVTGVQARIALAALRASDPMTATAQEGLEGGSFLGMSQMSYSAGDLWLELVTVTNSTGFFVIHPPETEAANGVYDLFMTTTLSPDLPGLNLTNWLWLVRADPGQTNLLVNGLTVDQSYFRLGRTNDLDSDGLSDAFERLVSHSDPEQWSTRQDGIGDLTAWLQGRNPRVGGSLTDTNGLIALEIFTPLR